MTWPSKMREAPPVSRRGFSYLTLNVGGDLLSHTLTSAVPSALEGLASGFGMGPGVPRSANTTDNTIPLSPHNPRGAEQHTRPRTTPTHTGGTENMVVCSGSHSGCEQQKC